MKAIVVLFLDDDESVINDIQQIFSQETYGVATTTSAQGALEILRHSNIKVVVSGQNMRLAQGNEFFKDVKMSDPDIVRIVMGKNTDFSSVQELLMRGDVYRYISKPWNTAELLCAIRRSIEHYDLIVRSEETNKKLKTMFDVQREFTSTVSHELRTPLASIKTAIDLVVKKTLGEINKDQAEVLGRAKRNVDRLKRLIDDILDLTKMESGKLNMSFMKNDIHIAIREVVEAQKDVAQSRGLHLKTALAFHIDHVPFDSDRIIQVLNNLVGNAIKFTTKGGITIKTTNRYEDDFILIQVIDTGKGIAEDDLPKLFRKFHQIESAESNEEGGTGLGLAISKEIILRHGGDIWVESKIDKGTSFNFKLPIER